MLDKLSDSNRKSFMNLYFKSFYSFIFSSRNFRSPWHSLVSFITFFYVSWRKYWFRANFRFPVFDGFTRFGMSWTRFDYFWKMSVSLSVCLCVCDKNFVASVARELMNRISWNFIFNITPTLISVYQHLVEIVQ